MKIHLADKSICTGCAACSFVCTTGSINMREDKEGFLQPYINVDTCIECHKCEKTCPVISPRTLPSDFETHAYAAINRDENIRMRSSSGGVFYILAKRTIEQGGVVFGARFNEQWEVVHDYTETLDGVEPFMCSKYVQSRIGDTFKQAKQFLEQCRKVLFIGTPCQIGGLNAYLRKSYDNLITADIICHGVPSPKVWMKYIDENFNISNISKINFRDKKDGWLGKQYITIQMADEATKYQQKQLDNIFFRGFIKNIYLRRSCYDCSFKSIHRCSDITMADFWGVDKLKPQMHDDKGTSLLFIHSKKGKEMLSELLSELRIEPQNINDAVQHNIAMVQSMEKPVRRIDFFKAFRLTHSFNYSSKYIDKDRLDKRILRKIARLMHLRK